MNFIKMHGLGNDFIVLDGRIENIRLSASQAMYLADRHFGVGCDQILILASSTEADVKMEVLNSDGSIAQACGNGSRCVAAHLMAETGQDKITIETLGGVVAAHKSGDLVAVDMGMARFGWQNIPLAHETDTMAIDLGEADLPKAIGVNMGNPHAVHCVDDAETIDLAKIGPMLEKHEIFPERANIEFISLLGGDAIRMRVWERGSGITIACGTGACAAAVAANRAGLTSRRVQVHLDGGRIDVEWRDDGGVTMIGPATHVFDGIIRMPLS